MRRLFWPLLGIVLLEGFFLGIVWWAIAAAALSVVVFLVCEAAKVHRTLEELIARFNAENPHKSPEAEGKRILERKH